MLQEMKTQEQGKMTPISHVLSQPEQKGTLLKNLKQVLKTEPVKCRICNDVHIVHPVKDNGEVDYSRTVPCSCVKETAEEKRRINLLRYCELPPQAEKMTFNSFKRSPELEEAYQECLSIAEGRKNTWVTMMGDTGRGKTHLAIAVCNYWLSKGKPAKYIYVPLLMKELKDGFNKEGDESYSSRYDTFLNAPLLVMDDLGTENRTHWVQEHLDTIFDHRLMHKLPTIVTTNLPLSEIPFRIAARLGRGGEIIVIDANEFNNK